MEQALEQLDNKIKEETQRIKEKFLLELKGINGENIPKIIKNKTWDETFGKESGVGNCYCCDCEINSKQFNCGHIISVINGGTSTPDNLKPICSTCHNSIGVKNIEEFKKQKTEHKCPHCGKKFPDKYKLKTHIYGNTNMHTMGCILRTKFNKRSQLILSLKNNKKNDEFEKIIIKYYNDNIELFKTIPK